MYALQISYMFLAISEFFLVLKTHSDTQLSFKRLYTLVHVRLTAFLVDNLWDQGLHY